MFDWVLDTPLHLERKKMITCTYILFKVFIRSNLLWLCSISQAFYLTLSWRSYLSYRNQSIGLLCKSMDWVLYDRDLLHERINEVPITFTIEILIMWVVKTKKCLFWIMRHYPFYNHKELSETFIILLDRHQTVDCYRYFNGVLFYLLETEIKGIAAI